jgi:hypothetical protein
MLPLYSAALFASAVLLFTVQPLVGKLLLPHLGGSPAVWNTCLVFFQTALLGGYLYAHATVRLLGPRRQAGLHLLLLAGVLGWLLTGSPGDSPLNPGDELNLADGADPSLRLLGVLAATVGLPFLVMAGSAPLLQRWFADTGHPAAANPYPLYAASNAGSFAALLGYPFVIEAVLPLRQQAWWWAGGVGVLLVLSAACAARLWGSPRAAAVSPGESGPRPGWGDRLRWVWLALVPSSLLMGVTNYLSTEVLSHPVLWIAPLALYLLTFIIVFAAKPPIPHSAVGRWAPLVALLLSLLLATRANQPTLLVTGVHLFAFFALALLCHGELARRRPAAGHLTEFYLWMSVGGTLGGLFNALLAPVLFQHVGVAEYPLMVVLACLALPRVAAPSGWRDVATGLGVGGLVAAGLWLVPAGEAGERSPLANLAYGLPACLLLPAVSHPRRFALGLAVLLGAGLLDPGGQGDTLLVERNFYGTVRVTRDTARDMHLILHGNTIHSIQSRNPAEALEPTAYYFPGGPVSQIFDRFRQADTRRTVGVAGLGAGGIACYTEPGDHWTFYEIDPLMWRVAEDPRYFTFLRDCYAPRRATYDVRLGDARQLLAKEPAGKYGLLVLNAFSGCSPPSHLLTIEAMRVYADKLAAGGLLAYNASNRHLDLWPVIAAQARELGLACRMATDRVKSADEWRKGKESCVWVVLARTEADLGSLATSPDWQAWGDRPTKAVWTDDHNDVLGALK